MIDVHLIDQAELESLMTHEGEGSVSLYMPSHPAGQETRQDRIRLKNLLAQAETTLAQEGLRDAQARQRIEPARALLGDSDFWRHQARGLAAFLCDGPMRLYRLGDSPEELVLAGRRFHLTPLLGQLDFTTRFCILAISGKAVRLWTCSRYDFRETPLARVPRNLDEILQAYAGSPAAAATRAGAGERGRTGNRPAAFHGQGDRGNAALDKTRLQEYCRKIDAAVAKALRGQKAPLILAAAEPFPAIYREVSTYAHLDEAVLAGTPDGVPPQELHHQAMEKLAPRFEQQRERSVGRFYQLTGTPLASSNLNEVLAAAHSARVESLFVDLENHCWGRYEPQTEQVELHESKQPGDQDLLDLAAVRTRMGGGTVFPLPRRKMPAPVLVAATFRYGR